MYGSIRLFLLQDVQQQRCKLQKSCWMLIDLSYISQAGSLRRHCSKTLQLLTYRPGLNLVCNLSYVEHDISLSQQAGPQYKICSGSVHRLLIAAVLIAAKLMDDKFYSNSFYARVSSFLCPYKLWD